MLANIASRLSDAEARLAEQRAATTAHEGELAARAAERRAARRALEAAQRAELEAAAALAALGSPAFACTPDLFPELIASGVTLTNGSGVFSPSLGEFALAAILYFAKDFRRMIRNQMVGLWEPFDVMPIAGQTVGIIGYGDIGRAVAARVKAVGMNVLAVKRHVFDMDEADSLVDQMYGANRQIEMLPRCDYVVVAAPLNVETRGFIGEAEFAAMKQTAVVINVGRGPVIDERAMIKALSEHKIKGAALDVFDEEPLPKGHSFYTLENVLLSPHCADHTPDWLDNAMRFFIAQFERFRLGEPLLNVVDKKSGY